jgi:hypothetical protein
MLQDAISICIGKPSIRPRRPTSHVPDARGLLRVRAVDHLQQGLGRSRTTAGLCGTGVSAVQRIKAMMKRAAMIPAIGARTAERPERWCGIFLDHCAADGLDSVHRERRPSVRCDRRGDRDGLDPGEVRMRDGE